MTVYVDPLMNCIVSGEWRWRQSCHLFVAPETSIDVLHDFAARIGMRRAWFQDKPGKMPHYDLNPKRRAVAVNAGATELDRRTAVEFIRRWRALLAASRPAAAGEGQP